MGNFQHRAHKGYLQKTYNAIKIATLHTSRCTDLLKGNKILHKYRSGVLVSNNLRWPEQSSAAAGRMRWQALTIKIFLNFEIILDLQKNGKDSTEFVTYPPPSFL